MEPTQTCLLCGRVVVVKPDARRYPPDAAKEQLRKLCHAANCKSEPTYRAGVGEGLVQLFGK